MEHFSEDDLIVLKSVFDKYDSGKDGYLTKKEFTKFLTKLGKHVEELKEVVPQIVEAVFAYIDINSDGKLDFNEFCIWWSSTEKYEYFSGYKSQSLRKAYELYRKYSKSEKGMNFTEYTNMLDKLSIQYGSQDFELVDNDKNGDLSFEEFCKWLDWF